MTNLGDGAMLKRGIYLSNYYFERYNIMYMELWNLMLPKVPDFDLKSSGHVLGRRHNKKTTIRLLVISYPL